MAERWVPLDKSVVYTYHPNGPRPIGTIGIQTAADHGDPGRKD